ncbi:F5/8_type C domain-containing protein [Hexamita inflata]|uniref:F5/8 type C domain-containing protein n=1 Tax=Hexamita inflata TaxID=28002 RepID=A0AA86U1A4_9EUKA|nr:F5/8 type C domain-containing protein [Hexamita inflata]
MDNEQCVGGFMPEYSSSNSYNEDSDYSPQQKTVQKVCLVNKQLTLSCNIEGVTRSVSDYSKVHGGLTEAKYSYLESKGSWLSLENKIYGQYLELDFHKKVVVGQIISLGDEDYGILRYKAVYGLNGDWFDVGEFKLHKYDKKDPYNKQDIHIVAEKIRIYPLQFFVNSNYNYKMDVSISEDLSGENLEVDQLTNINSVVEQLKMQHEAFMYERKYGDFDRKIIEKYKNSIRKHKIMIPKIQQQTQQRVQRLQVDFYMVNNVFTVYCDNLENILEQIKNIDPNLQTVCEPCNVLCLNGDDLMGLNFLNQFTNTELIFNKCSVNFDQKINREIKELTLQDCQIYNMNEISTYKSLEILQITSTVQYVRSKIYNIDFLKDLTNLRSINISNSYINSITVLSNFPNLTEIIMMDNEIADIQVLAQLTKLTKLYMRKNNISDIESLKELINLKEIDLGNNSISNIDSLRNLTNITKLILIGTNITKVEPLKNLTDLEHLNLRDLPITDISEIKHHPNFLKYQCKRELK